MHSGGTVPETGREHPAKSSGLAFLRSKMKPIWFWAMVVSCAVPACNSENNSSSPRRFLQHQFVEAGDLKSLGESCSQGSSKSCDTNYCVHVSSDQSARYFCTTTCSKDKKCPHGWTCEALYPQEQVAMCIPPKDWAGEKTSVEP